MISRRRGLNVHRFLEGYGVRCRPIDALRWNREPNTIYGGRTVARLILQHGEHHAGLVVLCVKAASPSCFHGDVLFAVSRFLRAHREGAERIRVIQEFRGVDLARIRDRAQQLCQGNEPMARKRDVLVGLIADKLIKEEAA